MLLFARFVFIISPLPVRSHCVFICSIAQTFSNTSNDGLPCRLPTIFSMTDGVTPIADAKALLLLLNRSLMISLNR